MHKTRKILALALALLSVLAISAYAQTDEIDASSATKLERLQELMYILETGGELPDNMLRDFNAEIPRVVTVTTPYDSLSEYVHIGIALDYGNLTYNEIDEIAELTKQEVPSEIVDLFLDFTGFTNEELKISYAVKMPTPPLRIDEFTEEELHEFKNRPCPVWGPYVDREMIDSFFECSDEPTYCDENYYADNIEPHPQQFFMGRMISTPCGSSVTLGHPLSGNRTFTTTVHRVLPRGTEFSTQFGEVIGISARSIFNNRADITEVNMISVFTVSSRLPNGQNIANYRGVPRPGDAALSIRGMSGLQNVVIYALDPFLPGIEWKMLTHPDRRSQAGDSGAALIGSNRAVFGTRHGVIARDGRVFGIYTNVQRY